MSTGLFNQGTARDALAIVGGTLIDGTGSPPLEDATIVVLGGKIAAVGAAERAEIPDGASIIDARGKYVLPGLIDCHIHLGVSGAGFVDKREFADVTTENNLKAYLKYGVTTVFDKSAGPRLHELKAALAEGRMVGPRVFGARYGIIPPHAHPIPALKSLGIYETWGPFYPQVASVEDARAVIAKTAAEKNDGVKLFQSHVEYTGRMHWGIGTPVFSDEVFRALIDESHKHGLRVFVHIAFPSEARQAIEAGADVLAHSISEAEVGVDEVFQMMVERGAYQETTLAYFGYYPTTGPLQVNDPRDKVWPVLLDSLAHPESAARKKWELAGMVGDARRRGETGIANLRRAVDAGVKIALGSDAGGAGAFHGHTTIRELLCLVSAGLTPMQAIGAATRTAAEAIGKEALVGTVEAGKMGDLIILDANPLRDIANICKLGLVVKGGEVIDPSTLAYDDAPVGAASGRGPAHAN